MTQTRISFHTRIALPRSTGGLTSITQWYAVVVPVQDRFVIPLTGWLTCLTSGPPGRVHVYWMRSRAVVGAPLWVLIGRVTTWIEQRSRRSTAG